MEFESSRLLLIGNSDEDLYDLICNPSVSNTVVSGAALFYASATLLSAFVDLSPCYDVIGMSLYINSNR